MINEQTDIFLPSKKRNEPSREVLKCEKENYLKKKVFLLQLFCYIIKNKGSDARNIAYIRIREIGMSWPQEREREREISG